MTTLASRFSPSDAARLRDSAHVVGWGLAITTAVALVGAYLKANPTGAVAVQAVVVELGAGRLAVSWSDPHGPLPSIATIARRAGVGAAFGAATFALVLGVAIASHAANVSHSASALWALPVGLLVAGLTAMRDELLLRGLVLRALGRGAPTPVALGVCGLAGAASEIGAQLARATDDVAISLFPTLLAALLSVAFAVLWRRDRGAWLAWGAHAAWLFAIGPVSHGSPLDLRWATGLWGNGDLLASPATTIAVGVAALAALVLLPPKGEASGKRAAPAAS